MKEYFEELSESRQQEQNIGMKLPYFEKCFMKWVKSVITIPENEIISLDGKTLRGSRDDHFLCDVIFNKFLLSFHAVAP